MNTSSARGRVSAWPFDQVLVVHRLILMLLPAANLTVPNQGGEISQTTHP
jgi:hypothetical protein